MLKTESQSYCACFWKRRKHCLTYTYTSFVGDVFLGCQGALARGDHEGVFDGGPGFGR